MLGSKMATAAHAVARKQMRACSGCQTGTNRVQFRHKRVYECMYIFIFYFIFIYAWGCPQTTNLYSKKVRFLWGQACQANQLDQPEGNVDLVEPGEEFNLAELNPATPRLVSQLARQSAYRQAWQWLVPRALIARMRAET